MKMNPTVKKLWLKALRSGKYNQARGFMRVTKRSSPETRTQARIVNDANTGYCCLGVLTEVAVEVGEIKKFKAAHGGNSTPSLTVRAWAGLNTATMDQLSSLNDTSSTHSGKWPKNNFAAIANYIEKEL